MRRAISPVLFPPALRGEAERREHCVPNKHDGHHADPVVRTGILRQRLVLICTIVVVGSLLASITSSKALCAEPHTVSSPGAPEVMAAWPLPVKISDENSRIHFEVNSTWSRIAGTVSGITGELALAEQNDWRTVKGKIVFPVSRLHTNSAARDERVWEMMEEARFPVATLRVSRLEGNCSPQMVPCSGDAIAELMIRDRRLFIPMSYTAKRDGSRLSLFGEATFRWKDFGLADPPSLFSKVDEVVRVKYEMEL